MSPAARSLIDHLAKKSGEFGGLVQDRIRAVRRGGAAEAVHQMRVASRRLRAAVQMIHRLRPDRRLVRLFDGARRLTKLAGKVREIDVSIDALKAKVRGRARTILQKPLERLREKELRRLKSVLARSFRAFHPYAVVRDVLRGGRGEGPGHSISPRRMIEVRLSQARRRYGRIRSREDVRRLHRFRIAMKKLRYTAEILLPFHAGASSVDMKGIKSVQSVLGRLHDDHVTAGLFRRVGRGMGRSEAEAIEKACRALRADSNRRYRRLERIRMPWMG